MSKVAICIPCYNSREKLKRLLDSIAIQNFKDFVVIITDDSDGTLIQDFVDGYSGINIQYYKNCMRLGVARNTNQALRIAWKTNADYIKIMYHDDSFSSCDSLEKMVDVLESNKDAGIAFTNTYETGKNVNYGREVSDEQLQQLKKNRFALAYRNIIGAPSATLVRMNHLLMDETLTWFVDIEWYIQILNQYKSFAFIGEPLITIGISDTQLTRECINNPALILDESIYLYRKYQELRCENYMDFMLEQAERVMSQCNVYRMCRRVIHVYIYGAGEKGKECARFLDHSNITYEAFIVSDGKKHDTSLQGHDVMERKECLEMLKSEESMTILALNEKNRKEVIEEIKNTEIQYIIWK